MSVKEQPDGSWYQLTCDECGIELDDTSYWGTLFDSSDVAREIAVNDYAWQITGEHDYCPDHWHVGCAGCNREYHGTRDGLADWELSNMPDCVCPECLLVEITDLAEKEGRNW